MTPGREPEIVMLDDAGNDVSADSPCLPNVAVEGPKRRVRAWTVGRKRAFVQLIAEGYSPTRAAKEVGVSRRAAYRQRSIDEEFRVAWEEAREQQADLYEDALRNAALESRNIAGVIFGLKNLRPAKWQDRHQVDRRDVSVRLEVDVAQLSPEMQQFTLQRLQQQLLVDGDEDGGPGS